MDDRIEGFEDFLDIMIKFNYVWKFEFCCYLYMVISSKDVCLWDIVFYFKVIWGGLFFKSCF